MDCSLLGSSAHGIFPGKNTEVGCHFILQGIFLTQGLNPQFLHWQVDSLLSESPRKPQDIYAGYLFLFHEHIHTLP